MVNGISARAATPTGGWTDNFLKAFFATQGILIAHGKPKISKSNFCTNTILSRQICEKLKINKNKTEGGDGDWDPGVGECGLIAWSRYIPLGVPFAYTINTYIRLI